MGHRILVAEDDAPIMLGLRDALRGLGHSVAGMVSTAAEAVRQAESEKPDIILMDISLAGPMSGIEAADRIRQRLEIPVVFVTAHSDDTTLRQAQAAEPYGFVLKPFDKDDLRIAIELAVYKHRIDVRLRESERRFATILGAIGDAVISTDTRGIIDFVNRAAEALTGRSFPEAVGKPLPGFLLLLDPELRQPLAVDRTWNGEAVLIDAARREIPVVGSIAEMSSEGTAMSGQVVVLRDVTEERRAAELRESRRIEQIITEVSEEERRRFGRDLHDGLGQALTGAAFLCKTLEQKLDGKSQPESADARAIGKVLADATESARELARGLLPVPAQPDGLVLALERLAIQITSQCQIECRFLNASSTLISDAVMANHLFRIAQEAVNNAVKHADARHIDICLETVGRLNHLIVKDDGRGIAPNLQRRGSGIDIMRHRVAVIGGSFKVSSQPAGGTAVSCFFPVNA